MSKRKCLSQLLTFSWIPSRATHSVFVVGLVLAALGLIAACSDAPTDALSTAPEAAGLNAGSKSSPVIQVASPNGNDFATLQAAIDDNPGAVLQLQGGTYDIGENRLTIPHGLTLQGATDAGGGLLTTIEGGDAVALVHVRALGEHADEKTTLLHLGITMRDLGIEDRRAAVLHRAFDYEAGEFVFPGGGDLTVRGCEVTAGVDPEAKAFWTFVVEDAAITLENSTFMSGGDFAVLFDGAVYSSLAIRNNTIRPDDAGLLMNGQDFTFVEGQDPSKTGTARIVGNNITVGTKKVQGIVNTGLNVIAPRGPTFVSDNVVSVPGTEAPNTVSVGLQMSNLLSKQVAITGNQLRGGDSDDGKARIGLLAVGDKGRYAKNVFEDVWSTGVIIALPLLPNPESMLNTFLHNDFSDAQILPHKQPQFPPLPAVHWWLGPQSSKTSVTDNSGVEQLVLDQGTSNHFQGTSFLPAPANASARLGPRGNP